MTTTDLRILHAIPSLEGGGAERLCLDICTELLCRNINTRLMVQGKANQYQEQYPHILPTYVDSSFYRGLFRRGRSNLSSICSLLSCFKPNVIHTHLFAAEFLLRAAPAQNAKYFFHCHDNVKQLKRLDLRSISKEAITNYWERRQLMRVYRDTDSYFIAISSYVKGFLEKHLPKDLTHRIVFLPNAINTSKFNNNEAGAATEKWRFVSIGSLVRKKNHAFLVRVMKILKDKGAQFHLDIVGEGPLRSDLIKLIRNLDLEEEIMLRGHVPNVSDYLDGSTLYLHSALDEPFGLVIVEALASGLPALYLNGGGNADIAAKSESAVLIDEINEMIFADKIIELLADPRIFERMSNRAREDAAQYGIQSYVDQLIALYMQ